MGVAMERDQQGEQMRLQIPADTPDRQVFPIGRYSPPVAWEAA